MNVAQSCICAAFLLLAVGCGSTDESEAGSALIGTWESAVEFPVDESSGSNVQRAADMIAESAWGPIELRADKTSTFIATIETEGTWTHVGNEVIFSCDLSDAIYTFTVSADGKELRPTESSPQMVNTKVEE